MLTIHFDFDIIFIDDGPAGIVMDHLSWDDVFAIAKTLKCQFPDISLEHVTLNDIYRWTIQLPEFKDDPQLVNDTILLSIYTEWFEEENPI